MEFIDKCLQEAEDAVGTDSFPQLAVNVIRELAAKVAELEQKSNRSSGIDNLFQPRM